jgi:SAM-dependent methyltransferase
VEEAGITYVVPSESPSAWFSAAVRERACRARWPDGREAAASASMTGGPTVIDHLAELFRSKYGDEVWRRHFAGRTEALAIDPQRSPVPPTAAERIRGEFDAVASSYDASMAGKPIDRYLKDRVAEFARRTLQGLDPVLEIGPGTGYHTLRLLGEGHRVLAVDISERMLEKLGRRAELAGLGRCLTTRLARLGELAEALGDLPEASFAAALSAFGPFNLESDLRSAVAALGRLIRPGGLLVFTSLNRPGLSPIAWEFALLRPSAAGYRMKGTVPAGAIRYPLELHLRTLPEWDRTLSGGFVRREARAVSVLAPPFDSDRVPRILGVRGADRMRRWDAFLAARGRAWVAAEWVFLVYERYSPRRNTAVSDRTLAQPTP